MISWYFPHAKEELSSLMYRIQKDSCFQKEMKGDR
jgi:hypothetical protein